ncbi:DedA family protein [Haloferax sp. AS1]|uniref:YqaA family protein n=1 Tax=Haloferax sp. AS1 TaxID=2562277 RepID=UPI00165F1FC9|nr:VTT domain-containing protein [Haloferax sp. AS1]MBC9988064.1 DedA family protein [Haloferax sp. AS1]
MLDVLETVELSTAFFASLGAPGLLLVAFLEFFLLPVPPDLVLVPLSATNPGFALPYAVVATVGSVSAGLVGFLMGKKGGRRALDSRFAGERIHKVERYFERSGFVTVAFGAFAPIPEGYELLSIGSGVFDLDLRTYLAASVLGRGGRYALEAILAVYLGEAARSLTEVDVYSIIGVATAVVLVAYVVRNRWFSDRSAEPVQ